MTATEIIQQALNDGVAIHPDGAGSIRLVGDESMVQKWSPMIRENKPALLAAMSPLQTPAPCEGCSRFKAVSIIGKLVSGCLYLAPGEFFDGWRRIPGNLDACIWH